jgi:hypothetical protein
MKKIHIWTPDLRIRNGSANPSNAAFLRGHVSQCTEPSVWSLLFFQLLRVWRGSSHRRTSSTYTEEREHASMPRVGFDTTIPVRFQAVHMAIMISNYCFVKGKKISPWRRMGDWSVAPPFLTSALDGSEWLASSTGRFTPRERASGTHWIEGWVGPRAGLDAVEKRKISRPSRESNPGRSTRSPLLYRLSYPCS